MLNRDYFANELPALIEAAGQPLTVTLVLRTGHLFRVRRIAKVGDAYTTLETHPTTAVGAIRGGRSAGEKRLLTGPGPHWLTVAYESISHITLSAQQEEPAEFGAG